MILAALVALMVAMLMIGALTRGLVVHRRQVRFDQQRQQACWLADSALQRAVVRLRASADYSGEEWQPSLDVDGETLKARAIIRVSRTTSDSDRYFIHVETRWPDDPFEFVFEERQLFVPIQSPGAL